MKLEEQDGIAELPLGIVHLQALLAETPLILEVRYWGERDAPERYVFHRAEMLAPFLSVIAVRRPMVRAWRWDEVCRDDLAFGVEIAVGEPTRWS
jgi:hypothetical protein